MRFLFRLTLINTKIKYIPDDTFIEQTQLKRLDIIGNPIENVTRAMFSSFKQLRFLNLNNNQIKQLPSDVFSQLFGTWEILLAGNLLTSLPVELFNSVRQLNVVFLNDNQLEFIHADLFKYNPKLRRVNLSGNRLKRIDVNFIPYRDLILVQLDGNICIDEIYALKFEQMQNDIAQNCTGTITDRADVIAIGNRSGDKQMQKRDSNYAITFRDELGNYYSKPN
jgi:Leucine-rich repeat (LRR) protein